jgi:malonyl CoA-acyl carrier protein transacylase
MKIYMFPGQGAQFKGMGETLFDRFPERTQHADAILGYSIRELCLQDSREELSQTQFTQPALYVVNALSYFARHEDDGGRDPDMLLGHSLGEFDALMAAGCFDFETGLQLVKKRGELMSQAQGGAMAAVINASREEIEEILRENDLSNVYLANYNSPSQIVLSGLRDEIDRAQPLFRKGRIRFYPLATSGAFHSVFMRESMEQFRGHLAGVTFSAPRIPVVANVTARPYRSDEMLETLASQIASAVRWSESVQYLLALAKRDGQETEFVELGPGEVLTRLVSTIQSQTVDTVLDALLQDAQEHIATEPVDQTEAPIVVEVATDHSADASIGSTAPAAAAQKVSIWNARYPVGTQVRSMADGYGELETRTEAMLLFGHRAGIYIKGYNGYFDLDELIAV